MPILSVSIKVNVPNVSLKIHHFYAFDSAIGNKYWAAYQLILVLFSVFVLFCVKPANLPQQILILLVQKHRNKNMIVS